MICGWPGPGGLPDEDPNEYSGCGSDCDCHECTDNNCDTQPTNEEDEE